jgi:hypothetical protein
MGNINLSELNSVKNFIKENTKFKIEGHTAYLDLVLKLKLDVIKQPMTNILTIDIEDKEITQSKNILCDGVEIAKNTILDVLANLIFKNFLDEIREKVKKELDQKIEKELSTLERKMIEHRLPNGQMLYEYVISDDIKSLCSEAKRKLLHF